MTWYRAGGYSIRFPVRAEIALTIILHHSFSSEFINKIDHQAQKYADYDARDDREVEAEIFPLYIDIPREPSEIFEKRHRVFEQHKNPDQYQYCADDDKALSHPVCHSPTVRLII